MRILHIGKYYPPFRGGIENFNALVAEGTARAGHAVAVVCHANDAESGSETIEGVDVHRAQVMGKWMYTPLAPFFLLDIWRRLKLLRPELIHVHLPNVSAFWLLLCPLAYRCPWVLHWHADVEFDEEQTLGRLLYRAIYRPFEWLLLKRADTVLVTSPNYLRASRALRGFQEKCRVIPLACREAPRPAQEPPEWPEGELRLLMVGRLTSYKGHGVLVNALAALEAQDVRIATIMVGGGSPEAELFCAAQRQFLERRVRILSELDDDDLSALYDSCDLVCLPSLNRAEAFGMVLLEAMAHGKPVVASHLVDSGVSWVVEEEKTGWLFPVGDSEALAQRLDWCRQNPEALAAAGSRAQQRLQQRFGEQAVLWQLLDCYREVINERGG